MKKLLIVGILIFMFIGLVTAQLSISDVNDTFTDNVKDVLDAKTTSTVSIEELGNHVRITQIVDGKKVMIITTKEKFDKEWNTKL